jgi:hypothetical protein
VANGGTGVTTSSGANSVVLRDSNANISVNCLFEGYSNVAASGTAIVLTASSAQNYVITGSGGQTIRLPNATTLPSGALFTFNNNQTSGAITVQNASSTTIATIQSGGYVVVVLLDNSTSAGSWDKHDQTPANVSWSTNTLSYPGSITSATWNGTAVGPIYGGTGLTSYTTGDSLYASASNTLAKLPIGSSGQVLTVVGGIPAWSSPASGASITDDTTTNATRYINFTSATTGTLSTIYTSSTKLQYNPSTGTLTTTAFSGSGASLTSLSASNINSGLLTGTYGGTGVNNGSNTITLGGNLTTSGAFATTLTVTASTNVTLPTTGTLATLAGTETFTNKTLTNPTVTNYVETLYAPAAGSAFTISLANGTIQEISLNGNGTITLPSSVAGKSYTIIVTYSGAYTLTWAGGSTLKWSGGTAPTATSVSGKYDIFNFYCDGTNTYGSTYGLNY